MIFEKQQYQQDCINNIITVLNNVDFDNNDFSSLFENLKSLSKKHYYSQFKVNNDKRLDVVMETGTGKTFTYLQAIFELHKKFNQTKFIIVLPRSAIKLGVIQNIKLTAEYFFNEYGKHLNTINYPEDGLSSIQQNFIHSNELSILITTNSAFNSGKNNINKKFEGLFQFGSIWQGISSKNPIVIIDEPHLLKGSETTKGLDKLKNSLFIRFGATYPDAKKDKQHQLSNVVYMLDSVSAFNQYLVKKIGVSTIFARSEISNINISNIKAKHSFDVAYNVNEQLHKTKIRVKEDFGLRTGLPDYQGFVVVKVNAKKIFLNKGSQEKTIELKEQKYQLSELEIRQMIVRAIELHFEKEQALFEKNIKALALFFIPSIDDFRGGNPLIKNIFEREYKIIRDKFYQASDNPKYQQYLDKDYKGGELQVAQGYFSGDRGTLDKKESDGVNIILNEKEKLLSFDTPLRFVFSVWALQEGWDNPNIFTICKLSSTNKEASRRQQVGRGLRIALNQSGKRLTYHYLRENQNKFFDINTLDMVVSGQEQDFIHQIQNEIIQSSFTISGDTISVEQLCDKNLSNREASHLLDVLEENEVITYNEAEENYQLQGSILDFLSSDLAIFSNKKITNERLVEIKAIFASNHKIGVENNNKKSEKIKIKQQHWKHFQQLWEAINKKSTIVYQNIEQQNLINIIAKKFNAEIIDAETIRITKEIYDAASNRVEFVSEMTQAGQGYFNQQGLNQFITQFTKDENLPLDFVLKLFDKLNMQQFYNSPKKAKNLLKTLIKDNIHGSILSSVGYAFNQTNIYPNELQDKNGNQVQEITHTKLGKFLSDAMPKDEFLYDRVIYDSKIEEESIINDPSCTDQQQITVFAKLPKINIPTPYKTYNPDFAYLIEKQDGRQLFLVVETKGYKYHGEIDENEQQKIEYAKVFFQALQAELPSCEIKYQTRINAQSLSDLLPSTEQCQ